MNTLDGTSLAQEMRARTADKIAEMEALLGRIPCLAVVLVGEDAASKVYVRNKEVACGEVGIRNIRKTMPDAASTEDILQVIKEYNADPDIHGILVQLPLPAHVDKLAVLNAISPDKDVDGFHASNLGGLMQNSDTAFRPCTPLAVLNLLDHYDIEIAGKNVAIVNRSIVVGQPLAAMLLRRDATVTVCHEHTRGIADVLRASDIIVVAVGKRPKFTLTRDMVTTGATVIDVGFNRVNGRMVGDADFDEVSKVARLTPVPGGVGPVTVAVLLQNTVEAAHGLLQQREEQPVVRPLPRMSDRTRGAGVGG